MRTAPVQYMGGKSKIAHWITSHFPTHRTYVEVFGGSGAVLLTKTRCETEVYNDNWAPIVSLMRVIRDRPEDLRKQLHALDPRKVDYETFLARHLEYRRLIMGDSRGADDLTLAVAVYTCAHFAMNADLTNRRPSAELKSMRQKSFLSRLRLNEWSPRLQGVVIENLDFRECIAKYDGPDTLFYLDPPYFDCDYYNERKGLFPYRDHYDLSKILSQIQGMAVVSYYPHPAVEDLYKGWKVKQKRVTKNSSDLKPKEVELLLMNYRTRLEEAFG